MAPFKCPRETVGQGASMHNTRTLELKHLNEIQPSFIFLFTHVISPLRHVKMSSVVKD